MPRHRNPIQGPGRTIPRPATPGGPPLRAHRRCALSLAASLLGAGFLTLGAACGGSQPQAPADEAPTATARGPAQGAEGGGASSTPPTAELFPYQEGAMPISPEAKAAIEEMMRALQPVEETVTSDVTDQWFIRHNKLVGDLVEAGREIGVASLTAYANYGGDVADVNRGLLTVAAHAAPEDSRDLLKTLMLEYGFPMDHRAVATRLLAETSPETFLEHAERFLRRRGLPSETAPNDEFFVRGWVVACDKVGRSPVDVLADVVTNMAMEPAARHYAAEALGHYPDPVGRAALETALIESTGNHYLRRKAAQALRECIPREDACDLFLQVMQHETDYNFQVFMRDMIEMNCR